jgi:hypothetical protein
MGLLTKAQILAAEVPVELIDVPEWAVNGDSQVRVRGLSAGEREHMQRQLAALPEDAPDDLLTARMCALCIVDENGQRVFSDAEIPALSRVGWKGVDRIVQTIYRLSAMGAHALEDARKN